MNADEIVKALRRIENSAQVVLDGGFGTHEGEHDTVYRKRRDIAKGAADLIESQQKDIGRLQADCLKAAVAAGDYRMENNALLEENKRLQAALTESRRREKAAVDNCVALVGLIADRLAEGSIDMLCKLANELEVIVADQYSPQDEKGDSNER